MMKGSYDAIRWLVASLPFRCMVAVAPGYLTATHPLLKELVMTNPGAWTAFNFELTAEAKKIFAEAVTLVGVSYTPFAFATQVVAGHNYSFLSKAQPVVPDAPLSVVKIHIYQPLPGQGKPHITQIIQINP